ncbi:oligosaccharide flippase family protein [Paraflavitalea sp. CAU 1676]|uniref:oligosaccharide flippase family protein n=1 Tax=Paraflavitalea sp. CAU 1676 TaxID=3032598 RepID=UPI0023DAF1B8|nr:oligosaccharide flippase family protein [Paraflavitalea sp. CAU 1676]MDF2189205.1 oligosaccharide flippase family protein [Paraflavitalea sp. CAU 1676]
MANLKKNLVYNFGLSVSQVLIPFISIPYIARVLDPDGIGRVSFIDSLAYYMVVIAEMGLLVYGTRAISRQRQHSGQLAKTVAELIALHLRATGVVLLIYGVAVFLCWQKIHDWRLVLFSLSFVIMNAFACEWYFRGTESFRYIALRSLFTRLLGLVSIFILLKAPSDYFLYYGIIAGSAILNAAFNWYQLTRLVKISFRTINWRQHIAQARFIYYISITYSITLLLDNVLLRLVSTAAAVGLYAYSAKVVRISTALITDSLLVFFPRIVAMNEAGTGEADLVMKRNLQLLIFFAVPLSAGIFLMAEDIVLVMFGAQFLPAVMNIKILSLFPCIKSLNLFLGNQVLMAGNHERAYLRSLLITGLLFLVLTPLLAYYWADTGACISLLVAETITGILNIMYVQRLHPAILRRFDGKSLLQAVGVSVLFFPVVYTVNRWVPQPLWQLSAGIVVCLLLYFSIQFFIAKNTVALLMKDWLQHLLKTA